VADFLEEKRREIAKRLKELEPLVDEFRQLEAAAAALSGVGSRAPRSTPARASNRGRRRSGAKGSGRRGRPRGSGTRSLQALELVKAQPGVTISELADKMGIKQNYLYRVLPGLEADGKVTKRGRGWHAKGA